MRVDSTSYSFELVHRSCTLPFGTLSRKDRLRRLNNSGLFYSRNDVGENFQNFFDDFTRFRLQLYVGFIRSHRNTDKGSSEREILRFARNKNSELYTKRIF